MANAITKTGLTTDSYADLLAYYTNAYQTIYGADVNLDSDSPDGQMMGIQIQAILDLLDLITQVNASFDPNQAIGTILDLRVALNGIQRQGGTYTITPVTITTTTSISLPGLDQDTLPVYTVADDNGNQWLLITSTTIATETVLSFRAANPGAVTTTLNTITVPVTVILGVTAINNPSTYSTLGLNEETDAALKLRRMQSVTISSQGYLSSLLAALKNITGAQPVFIYENNTDATDINDIPGHSIWVIVSGGDADEIGNAIYLKRNAGCGMKGDLSVDITQADGSIFTVLYDLVEDEDLYISFTATSLDGVNLPDAAFIKQQLALLWFPGVNEQLNINDLATLVQSADIDPNCLVTLAGLSKIAGGYTNTLTPSAKKNKFLVDPLHIAITVTAL